MKTKKPVVKTMTRETPEEIEYLNGIVRRLGPERGRRILRGYLDASRTRTPASWGILDGPRIIAHAEYLLGAK